MAFYYSRITVAGLRLAALACTVVAASAGAAQFSGGGYSLDASGAPAGAQSMSIKGPKGFYVEVESLYYSGNIPLADGAYSYQISGALSGKREASVKDKMNNGRGSDQKQSRKKRVGVVDTGSFRIANGSVVQPGAREE